MNEASPYREELTRLAEEKGADFLYEKLQKVDPKSAQIIHAHNVKRIIRALEFYQMTGEKISEHNIKQREKSSPYQFAYFVLQDERTKLYKRIEARIDEMLQDGLIEEVTALKEMGLKRGMVSMQGLGYKEILAYLDGECTLEEAVEILKRDTRHFAKRQITWFKREEEVIWLDKGKFAYQEEQILEAMLQILREKEII